MATPSTTTTVTVDRISNSGNAIAEQTVGGKSVIVSASPDIGETLEVQLTDQGGYFEATLVDRASAVQPRQPGIAPDTSDVGQDLLNPDRNTSHSFSTGHSPVDEADGQELRSWVSSRKMG